MKRRDFLKISAIASIYILTGCESKKGNCDKENKNLSSTDNKDGLILENNLNIPTLLNPELENGVKVFNLNIEERTHQFYKGVETKTYGIDSTFLGPTLLLRDGENVKINYNNRLNETTTIHGHGMHVPANMDGGPHQKIGVGQSWSAEYQVNQRASTNWYHPHLMGKTAEHVYKGLAGLIIIEDSESDNLNIPNIYGVDDIPLIVQDRIFSNFQFDYSPSKREIMHGYRGDIFIANGQISPNFSAKAGLLRIRILNGSNASLYKFSLSDSSQFYQISTDNSFLEKPVKLSSVTLSPAERGEIIIDLSQKAGKTIKLNLVEMIDGRSSDILNIYVEDELAEYQYIPEKLTSLPDLDYQNATHIRKFVLDGSGNGGDPELTINGKVMSMGRVDEIIPLNQLEIWEVENKMGMDHNFHIHATHFRIIDRDGDINRVAENEKGFKDVVYLKPNSRVRLLVKMVDYTDSKLPYMYHCHFLEHEDKGMMGQFTVV